MIDEKDLQSIREERAILVAVKFSQYEKGEVEEHLAELTELAMTANAVVCRQLYQERSHPDRTYFIGRG
ncbi:MAG TPA: GTPase HflX, partial [Caldithrix abyssi]|nr:GTPase HflX [Caldithrix abyssi]